MLFFNLSYMLYILSNVIFFTCIVGVREYPYWDMFYLGAWSDWDLCQTEIIPPLSLNSRSGPWARPRALTGPEGPRAHLGPGDPYGPGPY